MRRVLGILITVVVTAVASGGAVYYFQNKKATDQQEVLQGNINSLKLQLNDQNQSPSPPAAAQLTDNDVVIALVKADCGTDSKIDVSKGTFTVKKLAAPFATVSFNCAASPANSLAILKKVGDTWAIVFKGDKAPSKDVIDKYQIPKDFQS